MRTWFAGAGALLLCCNGCKTTGAIEWPAAQPPVLASVSALAGRSCAWTNFAPDNAGKFELLPSGHPNGDVKIVFRAPYPSQIEVDVIGRAVLPHADDSTDLSHGYYRIDSIELAETSDTFVWKVTVTPPTFVRLLPGFDLNIRNVSVNPSLTGTDKTSAPLTLWLVRTPVANVDAWLNQNTNVRDALRWDNSNYWHWSTSDKQLLRDAFELAWNGSAMGVPDPPANRATVGDSDSPTTVLSAADAKAIFIAHAGVSLAAEIAGWTSWSISAYSQEQLELLFDSRRMFRWNGQFNGFEVVNDTVRETVVAGSPRTVLEFAYANGLFTCLGRQAIIARALAWSHANLSHFANGFEAKNMEDQWQYRGFPPVSRIIAGTPYPNSGAPSFAGPHHRTAGCPGTTAFLHAVLRLANIPVKPEIQQNHVLPYFITEDRWLSHGDDPYSRFAGSVFDYPARELLIDRATHDAWFGSGAASPSNNIGRQVLELGIKYLPEQVLRKHCDDIAKQHDHATSDVYAVFTRVYTVADLEALNLWGRIETKLNDLGGCAALPPP